MCESGFGNAAFSFAFINHNYLPSQLPANYVNPKILSYFNFASRAITYTITITTTTTGNNNNNLKIRLAMLIHLFQEIDVNKTEIYFIFKRADTYAYSLFE